MRVKVCSPDGGMTYYRKLKAERDKGGHHTHNPLTQLRLIVMHVATVLSKYFLAARVFCNEKRIHPVVTTKKREEKRRHVQKKEQ